jgi:DUF3040 family protein
VEVIAVLDPDEKHAFDGMVTQIRAEDPRFARRIDRLGRRPLRQLRMALAILLWTLAPVCMVFGGWTGVLLGVVAVAYGGYLMSRRGLANGEFSWWSSAANGRPGASL